MTNNPQTPLSIWLSEIRRTEIVSVIECVTANTGCAFDYTCLTFPEEQDPDEIPIPKDHVEIVAMNTQMQLKKTTLVEAVLTKARQFHSEPMPANEKAALESAILTLERLT